jgi:hypothetical protein
MPSFEVLLPVGAIAFYLFDSAMLLYSNELLLHRRAQRWTYSAGSNFFLLGRRLWLANPFEPQYALFRVAWSETDRRPAQDKPQEMAAFLVALRPLRYLVLVLLILLIGGLPLSALLFGAGIVMLAVIGLYYACVLLALAMVYARREIFGLGSARAMLSVAFDVLACPPFAVNLVRKLSLQRSIAGNPIEFARLALEPQRFATLVALICARVDSDLRGAVENSANMKSLQEFRAHLEALASCPQMK